MLITLSLLAILIVIFGNSITLVAVATFSKIQTNTNILVSSLAVVDILVGITSIGYFIQLHVLGKRTLLVCHVISDMYGYCLAFSLSLLFFITVDRYIAIIYPLRYNNWITTKRVLCLVIATWMIISSYVIFEIFRYVDQYDKWMCWCIIEDETAKPFSIFTICFLLCVTLMYFKIFWELRRQRKRMVGLWGP